jgi:hypothetical protein
LNVFQKNIQPLTNNLKTKEKKRKPKMKNTQLLRYFLTFAVMLASSVLAAAQTGLGVGRNSSDSNLNLSARARTALQLDISTATGGATVTGANRNASNGNFALDFGDVNGLGLGTPSTGVTVSVQAGGALYTTPITLTPRYSGFGSTSSISIMLDATTGNAIGRAATREGAAAGSVSAPSTTVPNIFKTDAVSGTPFTRYAGIFVSNVNGGAAVDGVMNSRLVYEITVP